MTSKHTPGEWHIEKPHGCDYEIWHGKIGDKDRELIAEYMSQSNAEFIVQTCNSYYELLEALKAVYTDIELQNVQGGCNELNFMVQQAIAKAER